MYECSKGWPRGEIIHRDNPTSVYYSVIGNMRTSSYLYGYKNILQTCPVCGSDNIIHRVPIVIKPESCVLV